MTDPLEIDPYATVKAAGVQVYVTPETTYQPPVTPETPNPAPVVTPESRRLVPDLAALPDFLKSPDGPWLDLPAAVAILWQIWTSLEIRSVAGVHTVTTISPEGAGTAWAPGLTIERAVTWQTPAPTIPTGSRVSVEAGLVNVGKTIAVVKPGSLTTTGCVIQATNISGGYIVINDSDQIVSYTVEGQYLYTPVLDLGAP